MIRRAATAIAAGALASLALLIAPARAQVPAPPPETAPVFEVVAPTVSPICGDALLAVAVAPGIVAGETGGAVPFDVLIPAFGPLVVICGSVPAPPVRLRCDADNTVNDTLNSVVGAAAGTPLPIGVAVIGSEVEQGIVLQDQLPAPANSTGLLDMAVTTLNCKAVATVNPPAEEPAPDATVDETPADDTFTDELGLPSVLNETVLPDITSSGPVELGSGALPATAAAAQVGGPGFAYPVVFALPLILLAIGGYLGRSLTRPVGTPQR